MNYRLTTLLAILQQAEYDRSTFWRWVQADRPKTGLEQLNSVQPERWTPKLRLIRSLGSWLQLFFGAPRAVSISSLLVSFPQTLAAGWLLFRAARRLRQRQSEGLTVIAVAGSYGKTSVKHALHHVLSSRHFTLMTPESVNTPLGIAAIVSRLNNKHSVFLVEFGEQKPGDLQHLMSLVQPDIVVVTPIGFAHSEHFGSEKRLTAAFKELSTTTSPVLFIVDDRNRDKFSAEAEIIWYGTQTESSFRIEQAEIDDLTTRGRLIAPGFSAEVTAPLLGQHQLVNHLPGVAILNLDQSLEKVAAAFHYCPPVPRRLEVHRNPNGTVVIDNSYNTNPGSWQEMKKLITSLSLGKVVIITAGFVELDSETTKIEHGKLTEDLKTIASGTIILRSRFNQPLRHELAHYAQTHSTFRYGEADSLSEALEIIGSERWPLDVIWLEGGCRELYQ